MGFDKTKYDNDYVKTHYDRIEFTVLKGKRDELKALAKREGLSIAEIISLAIRDKYGLDLSK